MKAAAAQAEGRLAEEIVAVDIPRRKQEDLRFEGTNSSSLTQLLRSCHLYVQHFGKRVGSVTAGNASGLNDGAAALLLANEAGLKDQGLDPLAEIVSSAVVGVPPRIMGIGPVEASNRAMAKAGISWDELDVIELNEAFAAQSFTCIRSWHLDDDDSRINPNGGAIALGHPLGMTGSRIRLQLPAI